MSTPPDFAAKYAAIQQKFVVGLAGRQQEIASAADSASLHMALHRLAGAAAAMGFDKLAETARTAMQAASTNEAEKLAQTLAELDAALLAAQADGA